MLKKLWKWYTKFCGKLINVDYDAEFTAVSYTHLPLPTTPYV